ncbi:MAG TPA: OmpA family protein [Roseovarius sp.]
MRRNWLTSTTALALVLNAAAPLPGAALGSNGLETEANMKVAPQAVRLAQAETESAEADTAVDALEDALEGAGDVAKEEAEAAQQAADAAAADAAAAAAAEEQAAAEAAQQAAEAEVQAAEDAAEAAAQQAEAEAAAGEQQAAEDAAAAEAAQQAAEADAAAQAEADAAAQAEADAAAQAEADAEADAAAQAEADVAAQTEADAAAQAEADAAAEQQAIDDAAAQAEAEAAEEAQQAEDAAADEAAAAAEDAAAADAAAEQAAQDAVAEDAATAEPGDQTASDDEDATVAGEDTDAPAETEAAGAAEAEATDAPTSDTAEAPEVSAEAQAEAVAEETVDAPVAAAASGEGEVVETEEGTVTEDQARSSDEEFETTASGTPAIVNQAPAAKKKDNDLLKAVGIVAAAGLGAYAVGKLLDNGGEVVSNTGDRAVVRDPNGQYRIIKDDDTLLRQPGANVSTQTYSDGSTRTEVVARDNSSTVTIRAADGRVLRRTRILPDGQEVLLFDDTRSFDRVDVSNLRPARESEYDYSNADADSLRAALSAKNEALPDRTFSLNQIRRIDAVRKLVPVIALDAINFRTGSAVIEAAEAQDLSDLGTAMRRAIEDDPAQVFLIEGHTDTVGDASYNLALSDRRAESVALALTEYFDVPPSNMIVQGYGEADLRIKQTGDVRGNRRAAVRNITPLLTGNR